MFRGVRDGYQHNVIMLNLVLWRHNIPRNNPSVSRAECLGTILIIMEHPSKQVNLGRNCYWPHRSLFVCLSNNSCAIPFQEPIEHAEGGIRRNFNELATLLLSLQSLRPDGLAACSQSQISRVGHNFRDPAKIEHDIGNWAFPGSTAVGKSAEDISQGGQSNQLLSRRCKNGELIESSISHDFNRALAWEIRPDSCNRL